jgi:hypothetical protein
MTVIYYFCNKLECLPLARLCSLFKCLWVRPGAYPRVLHLKGLHSGWILPYMAVNAWQGQTL